MPASVCAAAEDPLLEPPSELFLAKYYHTNSQTLMVRYDEKLSFGHSRVAHRAEKLFFVHTNRNFI